MGSLCCKNANGQANATAGAGEEQGLTKTMFDRFDKENKGYISIQDLQHAMKDQKAHFQGKDSKHIMEKYGSSGKMTLEQFQQWWTSTYTTYNDEHDFKNMVDEVTAEHNLLDTIGEDSELANSVARDCVAVTRS